MTRKEEIVDAAKEYTHNEGLKQIRGDWKSQEAINIQADNALFTNEDMINTFKAGAEWADVNPVHYDGKAYLYVLNKGVEQGKKEMLDEVCKWLEEHLANFFGESYIYEEPDTLDRCLKSMKKAMEERV